MPPRKGAKRPLRSLRRGPGKDTRGRPGAGGRHEGRTPDDTPAAPLREHRLGTKPPPLRDHVETASALRGLLHGCLVSTGSTPASNPAGRPAHHTPDPDAPHRFTPHLPLSSFIPLVILRHTSSPFIPPRPLSFSGSRALGLHQDRHPPSSFALPRADQAQLHDAISRPDPSVPSPSTPVERPAVPL